MELDAFFLPAGISPDQLTSLSDKRGNGDAFATRMTEAELEVWSEVPVIEDQPDLVLSPSTIPQPVAEPLHIRDLAQPEVQVPPHGAVTKVESEFPLRAHRTDITVKSEPAPRSSNRYETPESSIEKVMSKQVMPEPQNDVQETREHKHKVRSEAENRPGPVTETETSRPADNQLNATPPERRLLARRLPLPASSKVSATPSIQGESVRETQTQTGKVQPATKHWNAPEFQLLRTEISPSPLLAGDVSQPSETSLSIPLAPSPVIASPQISGHNVPSQMQAVHSLIVAAPSDVVDIISQSLSSEDGPKERVLIQLDPPELGRVSIDFKFDAQGLQQVTITGETPEALRQLRMMHFELIQALEQRGLSGQDMTFRHQQDQQPSDTRAASDSKEAQLEDQLIGKGEQNAQPRQSIPSPAATNGLNITL